MKIYGFSKCLSVLYKKKKKKKKNHMVYMEKKFRPNIGMDETTLLHSLYGGKLFSKTFCAILTKIKGVSVFVSIPHCPMDYCIPTYSTVFFFLLFFFFFFFLFVFNL